MNSYSNINSYSNKTSFNEEYFVSYINPIKKTNKQSSNYSKVSQLIQLDFKRE
jgi:hypothetical protein